MSSHPTFSQSQMTGAGRLPPREGAGALLLWAALLLLGGGAAALGSAQQRQAEVDASNRVQVGVYYQAQAQRFTTLALAAGAGQPGSGPAALAVSPARDQAQQALSVLQRGGNLPALSLEVSPLPASSTSAARSAQVALTAFDQAAGPILASAEALAAQGDSMAVFDAAGQDFVASAARAAQSARLSSGPWGTAVNQLVRDLAPEGSAWLSSTLLAPSVTATDPRIALVRQRAQEMVRLAQASVRDPSLSSTDRALLAAMARSAKSMSDSVEKVLRQRTTVAAAAAAVPPALATVPQVEATSAQLVTAARQASSESSQWLWVTVAGWGVLLLALIMLVRQCWLAVDRQYQLTLDGRLGQLVLTANEKLSTRLRRILSLESRDSQLKEAPDSPNFVLASTINKLLDQRNAAASVMEDQGQALIQSLHEMDGLLSAMSSTQGEADRIVASSHINTGHFSALVSEFSDQLARLRQPMATGLDQVSRLSGLTQGALWKLDAVRETTQDASKRIKRLGESAQAVSSSSDSVRGIASQAKVLALNLAVEAAQRGEDGRVFADVAKELESLARDLDGAVGDIDFQSNAIQDDSRQTVEVMEQGVANVVECARLSGDATTAAKGLLAHVQDIDQSQLEISSGLSAAAQGVLSEQGSLAQALAGIRSQAERLEAMRERAATPRSAVQAFRAWLGQLGRDI
jgi:methyl-accepting chemotaxis protein